MKQIWIGAVAVASAGVMVLSCQSDSEKPLSSFDLIQTRILNVNCAISDCHQSRSDATFAQHNLLLGTSDAYNQLVNVMPKNANAAGMTMLPPMMTSANSLRLEADTPERTTSSPFER
jgi:hypothetical protein